MYQGSTLHLQALHDGLFELCFDRAGHSVNTLDALTLEELLQALQQLQGARGLLLSSARDSFIVGADIHEFRSLFAQTQAQVEATVRERGAVFTALAQLCCPTVAAVNGAALGGGLELALACDHRVMAQTASVGLPEVKLGLIPAYGGASRLPRIAGGETALRWITSGATHDAHAAQAAGVVDEVVAPQALRAQALSWLEAAAAGRQDWAGRRSHRAGPAPLPAQALERARAAAAKAAHHYPAAAAAVDLLEHTAALDLQAALPREAAVFARLCKTHACASLLRLFHNDQFLKRKARGYVKQARTVRQAAVLGAGIMGGGIAYASAVRGIPVLMKDISPQALELGMAEAGRLLAKQVGAGRMAPQQADRVRGDIRPQLDFTGFERADVVVEAIVEDLAVKRKVLAEVEALAGEQAVIASNTSSLSIADMAGALRRPGHFVGMHFFNPVPQMPLVEVICGPHTDPVAAATVAGYALAMGKTPLVVRDCPGFLVNRILVPYLLAFLRLVHEGADPQQVDCVMERFGWPMGPARLSDVIGLDTLAHVLLVISQGHAPRMRADFPLAVDLLVERGRLGQKSGSGFYAWGTDGQGRPAHQADAGVAALLAAVQPQGPRVFGEAEIVDRLMLPMVLEAARCLDEGVADSAIEVDTGLVLGIGFPRHLGGALHWADRMGLDEVVRRCARHGGVSALYQPSQALCRRAAAGGRFHLD